MDRKNNNHTVTKPQRPTLHSRHTSQLPLLINYLSESFRFLGDSNTSMEPTLMSGLAFPSTTLSPKEDGSSTIYSNGGIETSPKQVSSQLSHQYKAGKAHGRLLNVKDCRNFTVQTEASGTTKPPPPIDLPASTKTFFATNTRMKDEQVRGLSEFLPLESEKAIHNKPDVLQIQAIGQKSESKSQHLPLLSRSAYTITRIVDHQPGPIESPWDGKREVVVFDDVSYFMNRGRTPHMEQTTDYHLEDPSYFPSSGRSSPISEEDSCFSEEFQDSDINSLDGLDHAGALERQRASRTFYEFEPVSSDSKEEVRGRRASQIRSDTTQYFSAEEQSNCTFGFESPNAGYAPIDKRDRSPNWTRIERLKTRHRNLQKHGIHPAMRKRIIYGNPPKTSLHRSSAALNSPDASTLIAPERQHGLENIAEEGTFGQNIGTSPTTVSPLNRYKNPSLEQHSQETSSDESGVLFMKAPTKTWNMNSRARVHNPKEGPNNYILLDKTQDSISERCSSEESQASVIVGETLPLLPKAPIGESAEKGKQRAQESSDEYGYYEHDALLAQEAYPVSWPETYLTDYQSFYGDQQASRGSSWDTGSPEDDKVWKSRKHSWTNLIPELEPGSYSSQGSFTGVPRTPPPSPCKDFRKPFVVGVDPRPEYPMEAPSDRLYYDPITGSYFGPMVEKAPGGMFWDWDHRYTQAENGMGSKQLPSSSGPWTEPFSYPHDIRVNMARIDTSGSGVPRRQPLSNIQRIANYHDIPPLTLPSPRHPVQRTSNGTSNEHRGRTRTRNINRSSSSRMVQGSSSTINFVQNQRTTYSPVRRRNRHVSFAPLPSTGRTRRTSVGFIYRRQSRRRKPRSPSPTHRFNHEDYLYESSDSGENEEPKVKLDPVRKLPLRADTPPPQDESRPVRAISNQPHLYVHQLAARAGSSDGPMDLKNFIVPGAGTGAGSNGSGKGKKGKGKTKENGHACMRAMIRGPADLMPSILGTMPGIKPTKKGRFTRIFRGSDGKIEYLKEGSRSSGSEEANADTGEKKMEDWHQSLAFRSKPSSVNDAETGGDRSLGVFVVESMEDEGEGENEVVQNDPLPTPPETPDDSGDEAPPTPPPPFNLDDGGRPPSPPPPSEPGKEDPGSNEKKEADEPSFRFYINILNKDEIPLEAHYTPTPSPDSPTSDGSDDWGSESEHPELRDDGDHSVYSFFRGKNSRQYKEGETSSARSFGHVSWTEENLRRARAVSLRRHLDTTRVLRLRAGMGSGASDEYRSGDEGASRHFEDSGYDDEGMDLGGEKVAFPLPDVRVGNAITTSHAEEPGTTRTLCDFGPRWGFRSDESRLNDVKDPSVPEALKDDDSGLSTIAEDDEDIARELTLQEIEELVEQAVASDMADSLKEPSALESSPVPTISDTPRFGERQVGVTGQTHSQILAEVEIVSEMLVYREIASVEASGHTPKSPWHDAWVKDMLLTIKHLHALVDCLQTRPRAEDEPFIGSLWQEEWNDAFLQVVTLLGRLSDHFVDACQERQMAEQEREMRELDEMLERQAREMEGFETEMEREDETDRREIRILEAQVRGLERVIEELRRERRWGSRRGRGMDGWYDVEVKEGGLERVDGGGLRGMDALSVAEASIREGRREEEIGGA